MRIIISLHNQPKILRKFYISTILFSKKSIVANFHVYFQYVQFCEGALTLWRHCNFIWSSMVLILVSMDRRGPYLYTGNKYMGYQVFRTENPARGLHQHPRPFGGRVRKKNLRRTRGKWSSEKKYIRAKITKKSISSQARSGFYVIFKSPLYVITRYALMNRLLV